VSTIGKKRKRELQTFATLISTIIQPYIRAQNPSCSSQKKSSQNKPTGVVAINPNVQSLQKKFKDLAMLPCDWFETRISHHCSWEDDNNSSEEEIEIE
jgi:hypothetical protein